MAGDFLVADQRYLEMGNWELTEDTITILIWYLVPAGSWQDHRIMAKATNAGDVNWMVGILTAERTKSRLTIDGRGTIELVGVPNEGDDDTLHMQTFTYLDSAGEGDLRLYLDENEVNNSLNVSGGYTQTTQEVWIGDNPTTGGRDFDGSVFEIRIYDDELKPGAVETIFAFQGRDVLHSKMTHRWLLNEKHPGQAIAGTDVAKDLIGGEHGTQTNSSLQPEYTETIMSHRRRIA